jgi:hypothetical protein
MNADNTTFDETIDKSGKTLSMQLLPGSKKRELLLVFWTLSSSTWACDSTCPPGVIPGR